MEMRGQEHRDEIDGQEDPECGEGRAGESCDEIADERDRDHHRSWRDHRDRDGVDELSLAEPVELLHYTSVEKRHDREAASEDEESGAGKVRQDRSEEHTSELQSLAYLVCRLLLEKKK